MVMNRVSSAVTRGFGGSGLSSVEAAWPRCSDDVGRPNGHRSGARKERKKNSERAVPSGHPFGPLLSV
jgi:hypothetical protein